jgi:hypothetical protein
VGIGRKRRAATAGLRRSEPAARCCGRGHEEAVDLEHALLEPNYVVGPLEDEIRAELVAAGHLDREATHVADLLFAATREHPPFLLHL